MMLYALTPSHVGSGDNLSYIDMPIQRERYTNFPKIEASSLKGSIRYAMEQKCESLTCQLLGNKNDGEVASVVSVSDAKILFFPVKSAKGIFAWVTCPMVMKRFQQDCNLMEIAEFAKLDNFDESKIATEESLLLIGDNEVMLEEMVFNATQDAEFENWIDNVVRYFPQNEALIEKDSFKQRVIMISDDRFEHFVTQSTEVVTRIKIGENGVVEGGALFTEEHLPAESVLYSLLFFSDERKEDGMPAKSVAKEMRILLENNLLQIGGNTTLGQGLFRIKFGGQEDESTT